MGKVIALKPKKHIYELEQCAGCGKKIKEHYTEIGLPSVDNKTVTHIALCSHCTAVAKGEGLFKLLCAVTARCYLKNRTGL